MCLWGNYSWKTIAHKILKASFYWPKFFGDVHDLVKACKEYQIFAEKQKLTTLPLILVSMEEPFRQWGLYFIGEIYLPSSGQHKWILTSTDYFTKWVEAIPTKNATNIVVIKFMEENILARFGCPRKIIIDNAQVFKSSKFIIFCQNYNIILGHSNTYYPQGNGLEELSNKTLVSIIKKIIEKTRRIRILSLSLHCGKIESLPTDQLVSLHLSQCMGLQHFFLLN